MFEYRSLTVAFIHRPNARMRRQISKVVERIGYDFSQKCIGIHIRRGDSCNDKEAFRVCFDDQHYVKAAQRLRSTYNLHCIYIATDDSSAPDAIRKAFEEEDDKFVKLNANLSSQELLTQFQWRRMKVFDQGNDRSAYDLCPKGICKGGQYLENERHLYKGHQGFRLGMEMLIDIEFLAACTAFVGAFSSNNFRLAVELHFARQGVHPPYISLDTSWCYNGFGVFNIRGRDQPIAC
jgi:hypothetical protein